MSYRHTHEPDLFDKPNIMTMDNIIANKQGPVLSNNECYRKVSNIRRILVGNKIVVHSEVVGASPVGAAPTTYSFST